MEVKPGQTISERISGARGQAEVHEAAPGDVLALTPLGGLVHFATPPLPVLAGIGAISAAYLVLAELLKRFALQGGNGHPGAVRSAIKKRRRIRV